MELSPLPLLLPTLSVSLEADARDELVENNFDGLAIRWEAIVFATVDDNDQKAEAISQPCCRERKNNRRVDSEANVVILVLDARGCVVYPPSKSCLSNLPVCKQSKLQGIASFCCFQFERCPWNCDLAISRRNDVTRRGQRCGYHCPHVSTSPVAV